MSARTTRTARYKRRTMTLARPAQALLLAALCVVAAGCGGADRSPEAVADSLSATWQVQFGGVEQVSCIPAGGETYACGVDYQILDTVVHSQVRLRLDGDCWRTVATDDGDFKLRGCLPSS